jgi:hypothetical protein
MNLPDAGFLRRSGFHFFLSLCWNVNWGTLFSRFSVLSKAQERLLKKAG